MKRNSRMRFAAGAVALGAGLLAGLIAPSAAQAQDRDVKPGGPGDYLVFHGKQAIWASQVPQIAKVTDRSKGKQTETDGGRLSAVFVGKRAVIVQNGMISDPQIAANNKERLRTAVSAEKPERRESRWRLVEEGKRRYYVREN